MRTWPPPAERLAARLVQNGECLEWTGPRFHNGYGALKAFGEQRAHRIAYILVNGPIPPGLQIDHLCRNRLCCNPDHLEAVTREENIARGDAPSMVNARKTHCIRGHELCGPNLYATPRGRRQCRACLAASQAIYRQRRKMKTTS